MNDNVSNITESTLAHTTLDWFESMGYQTAFGPDISPDSPSCERGSFNSSFKDVLKTNIKQGHNRSA